MQGGYTTTSYLWDVSFALPNTRQFHNPIKRKSLYKTSLKNLKYTNYNNPKI